MATNLQLFLSQEVHNKIAASIGPHGVPHDLKRFLRSICVGTVLHHHHTTLSPFL